MRKKEREREREKEESKMHRCQREREEERGRERERNEVLKERVTMKPVYCMNDRKRGEKGVKLESSSIADRQLYIVKTD